MKKIILLSTILLLNFIFHSTVKAQDNPQDVAHKNQIIALLDSIKNCYTGLPDFNFQYQMKDPVEEKHADEMTMYKLEKEKNCDAACLCHSYISYKGTDKSYLELFYITSFKPNEFVISGDTLFLEKEGSNNLAPMSMSHPDPVKLLKIKKWMEDLSKYCSAVTVEEKKK